MNNIQLWMYNKTLHFFLKSTFSWKYTTCYSSGKVNHRMSIKKREEKQPLFTWEVFITENFSEYLFSALSSTFKITSNSPAWRHSYHPRVLSELQLALHIRGFRICRFNQLKLEILTWKLWITNCINSVQLSLCVALSDTHKL